MAVPLVKPDAGAAASSSPIGGGPAVSCYDEVARPNVIFMNGSTNYTPFIRAMAPVVVAQAFTIAWQATSSCTGADTVFNTDPARRVMRNPVNTSQSFAAFYTPANLPDGTPCSLGNSPRAVNANTELVDVGESDIFATSCPDTAAVTFSSSQPGTGAFADVRHYRGPAQAMVFVTPAASTQRIISYEAAAQIFGGGVRAGPWVISGQNSEKAGLHVMNAPVSLNKRASDGSYSIESPGITGSRWLVDPSSGPVVDMHVFMPAPAVTASPG